MILTSHFPPRKCIWQTAIEYICTLICSISLKVCSTKLNYFLLVLLSNSFTPKWTVSAIGNARFHEGWFLQSTDTDIMNRARLLHIADIVLQPSRWSMMAQIRGCTLIFRASVISFWRSRRLLPYLTQIDENKSLISSRIENFIGSVSSHIFQCWKHWPKYGFLNTISLRPSTGLVGAVHLHMYSDDICNRFSPLGGYTYIIQVAYQ